METSDAAKQGARAKIRQRWNGGINRIFWDFENGPST